MAKRKNLHAVALGRKGGKVMTPKKLAALKRNAQTAGRKPKYQADDRVDTGSVQDSNFDQCPQGHGLN